MTKDVDARLVTTDGAPVMLEGVRAEGALRGLLLEMSIEQRFRNPTDKNVEVVYTFPLPWGAVLLGVEVQLGDKHLTGTIVPKKDESYSLNLGNLAAAEACTVMLRYAQTLPIFRAAAGTFDATFYLVQGLELLAGATNLGLMGLNIRDGLRMSGRLRKS